MDQVVSTRYSMYIYIILDYICTYSDVNFIYTYSEVGVDQWYKTWTSDLKSVKCTSHNTRVRSCNVIKCVWICCLQTSSPHKSEPKCSICQFGVQHLFSHIITFLSFLLLVWHPCCTSGKWVPQQKLVDESCHILRLTVLQLNAANPTTYNSLRSIQNCHDFNNWKGSLKWLHLEQLVTTG